jgi:ABC-2 type transport system ATP-binding protein
MIEAEGLTKSFGATRALDRVSFTIAQGEVIGLLGPNGSGKTTLLRILTGFFPPDEGRATVAGISLDDDPFEVRRRVGYLPERAPLYPEVTVEQFLDFAARVKVAESRLRPQRVAAVIEECGLTTVAGRLIGNLSKGFRQRVGIAQALVGRPQVLVLDEPTAGLDPAQVLELRDLIRRLGERTTVLLSSHILADVASVCGRVLMLHHGRLVLSERIDRLRREVRSSAELVLRTRAEPTAVEGVVAALPRLRVVELERDEDGALVVHLARTDAFAAQRASGLSAVDESLAAELARACVGAGLPVIELGPRNRSLEDLFIELLDGKDR